MANTSTPRSRILGLGHYLPPVVRTNLDLEKLVDTSDAWITERTGIRERRIAPDGIVTSDMATHAANEALAMAGLKATDLDMIVVGTVTPDMPMPATAVFVQQKLGAGTCPAFDLSAACAGASSSRLTIADQFVRFRRAMKHVLVVGVVLLSRVIDCSDRTTCVLFGDGAGAVVIGPADPSEGDRPSGILSTAIHTDGTLATSLLIPGGGSVTPASHEVIDQKLHKVHMRGQDIFKVSRTRNLFQRQQKRPRRGRHDERPRSRLDLRPSGEPPHHRSGHEPPSGPQGEGAHQHVDRVGNTSSASIPILVDENYAPGRKESEKGTPRSSCARSAPGSAGVAPSSGCEMTRKRTGDLEWSRAGRRARRKLPSLTPSRMSAVPVLVFAALWNSFVVMLAMALARARKIGPFGFVVIGLHAAVRALRHVARAGALLERGAPQHLNRTDFVLVHSPIPEPGRPSSRDVEHRALRSDQAPRRASSPTMARSPDAARRDPVLLTLALRERPARRASSRRASTRRSPRPTGSRGQGTPEPRRPPAPPRDTRAKLR